MINKSQMKNSKKSRSSRSKYPIGEKVFHPFYGVGTVVRSNEERKILGKVNHFSIIRFDNKNLKIMVKSPEKQMIRDMISRDELPKLINVLKERGTGILERYSSNKRKRYNKNLEKLKSGDLYTLAEVLGDLNELSKLKKISTKEKRLFREAKKVFSDVLSSIKEMSIEDAEKYLNKIL